MNARIRKMLWAQGYRSKTNCCILAAAFFHSTQLRWPCYEKESSEYSSIELKSRFLTALYYGGEFALFNMECMIGHICDDDIDIVSKGTSILYELEEIWEELEYEPYKYTEHEQLRYEKTFVFTYPSSDGYWCSREKPSRCMIKVDSGDISMMKLSGVNPTVDQVAVMVRAAMARSIMIHRYDRKRRKYPFDIKTRVGYSGCRDVSLDLYSKVHKSYHRKYTAAELHISMCDKVSDFGMYTGDAVEILWSLSGNSFRFNDKIYEGIDEEMKSLGICFSKPPHRNDLILSNVSYDPKREW